MAGLADEVEVTRLAVGMLEPEAAFPEIDLAGDAGVDHPLQRAVDSGAADALVFPADEVDEIVGAQVPFLTEEDIDDLLALARALAAVRLQPAEIRKRGHTPLSAERGTAAAGRGGVGVLDGESSAGDGVYEVDFRTLEVDDTDRVDEQPDAVRFEHLIRVAAAFLDHQAILEARAAPALHEHTQPAADLTLFREQLVDLRRCRGGHIDHLLLLNRDR